MTKFCLLATVRTDAYEARFARFVEEVERRCPITQLFRKSLVGSSGRVGGRMRSCKQEVCPGQYEDKVGT